MTFYMYWRHYFVPSIHGTSVVDDIIVIIPQTLAKCIKHHYNRCCKQSKKRYHKIFVMIEVAEIS